MDKQPVKRGRGPPEGHCLREGGHQGSAEKPVLGAVLLQTPTPGPGRGERWGHGFGREHHAAEGTSPGRPRDRDARGSSQAEERRWDSRTAVPIETRTPTSQAKRGCWARHGALGCHGQLSHRQTRVTAQRRNNTERDREHRYGTL